MGRAVDHFVVLAVERFLGRLRDHPGVGEMMVSKMNYPQMALIQVSELF